MEALLEEVGSERQLFLCRLAGVEGLLSKVFCLNLKMGKGFE